MQHEHWPTAICVGETEPIGVTSVDAVPSNCKVTVKRAGGHLITAKADCPLYASTLSYAYTPAAADVGKVLIVFEADVGAAHPIWEVEVTVKPAP